MGAMSRRSDEVDWTLPDVNGFKMARGTVRADRVCLESILESASISGIPRKTNRLNVWEYQRRISPDQDTITCRQDVVG